MEKEKYIRESYIFSDWILLFSLLYYIGITNYNPVILLYLSIIFCIIQVFIYIIIYNIKLYNLIKFIILVFLLHIIPFLLIYKRKINYLYDITISILICLIYIIYNILNNQSIIKNYNDLLLNYLDRNKGKPSHLKYLFDKYIFVIL